VPPDRHRPAVSMLYDAILVNVATSLAFFVRFSGRIPLTNLRAYLTVALWITVIRILTFYFAGLYEKEEEITPFDIFYRVFIAVTLGSIIIIALSFYLRNFPFPRSVFAISWVFNILLISVWHSYLFYFSQKIMPVKRILVVGTPKEGKELIEKAEKCLSSKYQIVGLVSKDIRHRDYRWEDIRKFIKERKADEVIIADSGLDHEKTLNIIFSCQKEGIGIWIKPGIYEVMMGKLEIAHIGDIPLIKLKNEPLKGRDKVIKRGMDVLLSLLILVFSLPILLLIPLLIRMESRGSSLYRQKRVGEKGRIYEIYKFRSMFENAEEGTGPVLAGQNDERVTRVGSWLRRTHLDELPQLFNVLKGEMSLIGPRPERPVFVEKFTREIPGYFRRFIVKPGITGLAQLYGDYDTSAQNKIKYDLAYINNWSLGLDLKIFFMSLEIILRRRR